MRDPPSFWELFARLPHAVKISLLEEWDSRSGIGRLLYPVWVIENALIWFGLLTFGLFLLALAWGLKPLRGTSQNEEVSEA